MSTARQTALLRKGNPATAEKQVTLCADSVLRLEVDKRLNNHNTSGPPTLQENLMINYLNLREEQALFSHPRNLVFAPTLINLKTIIFFFFFFFFSYIIIYESCRS